MLDDIFTPSDEQDVTLTDEERARIEGILSKLVTESAQQGVSIVALKNHKISKPILFKLAKDGNSNASYVLSELNLRGILEEAKNPDTREEVATEMLARLVVCPVPSIRRRAIHLLLKINPEKFSEVINERNLSPNLKNEIFSDVIADEEAGLRIMLRMLKNPGTPQDIKDKVIAKIGRIRKMIEENSAQIIDWNHRIEDLEKRKRIKFHMVEKYYAEVQQSLDEFKNLPNFVMDLKFDVDLAFENLKHTIKE